MVIRMPEPMAAAAAKARPATPILYKAPLILAQLDGQKTQTRRLIKEEIREYPDRPGIYALCAPQRSLSRRGRWQDYDMAGLLAQCPFGQVGDWLWPRENLYFSDHVVGGWCYQAGNSDVMLDEYTAPILLSEAARKRGYIPSIHMPREAGRLMHRLTNVRVVRPQDISEEDAYAEGAMHVAQAWSAPQELDRWARWTKDIAAQRQEPPPGRATAVGAFGAIWEQIHGPRSWWENRLCWALTYKVYQILQPGEPLPAGPSPSPTHG
jgi:hypothetical protein